MSQWRKGVNALKSGRYWSTPAVAAAALACAVFLAGLPNTPVPTVDGAVRAVEARNILESGQWFPITYQGNAMTDHPPLFVWLNAIAFKIFGVTDFAANLPARLGAVLTVIFTYLLALEVGFSRAVGLLAALILCGTRDFVLSSVRGYIEPILEACIYGGLWFVLHQRRTHKLWPSFTAGLAVWLSAFAKGPPALWPLVFFTFLLAWNGQTPRRRIQSVTLFLAGIAAPTSLWWWWTQTAGHWSLWSSYFFGQVLGSAVSGREGAQGFEPLFFLKILVKFYWPWLPLLAWGLWRCVRWLWKTYFSDEAVYSWLFGVFALGFIAGFSLVKWKFWYYIAPAYPALALFIAINLHRRLARWVERGAFANIVLGAAAGWVFLVAGFPIPLHKERVPEVLAFRETIRGSPVAGPVWFVRNPMDHNMVGTSGEWYFHRQVVKVEDEARWAASELRAPAWILMGRDSFPTCREAWCARSTLVQSAGKSSLLYYR